MFIAVKDQKRTEKVSKRLNAIQEVKESVSLLGQLLENYSKDHFSHSQQELVKVQPITANRTSLRYSQSQPAGAKKVAKSSSCLI